MCIVQRYALIFVAILAGLASASGKKGWWMSLTALAVLSSGFGAFTAARQSWLQWYPPEVAMCGRDFYGMIENYPIRRAIPMIFKGSGDCTAIDWTFLGAPSPTGPSCGLWCSGWPCCGCWCAGSSDRTGRAQLM